MQTVLALEAPLIIFDTLTEAYVCLDTEFRITFLNKAAEPLLGTTRAELLGKTFWDVCPASAGTSLEEGGYGRAMAERIIFKFEQYHESRQRWYAITVMPDSSGGIVVQFSYITDREMVGDALR